MRTLALLFFFFPPLLSLAQQATTNGPNKLTERLLMAQRPKDLSSEQWQLIIRNPANAAALPIYLSPAILDTIDVKLLDARYRYVLIPGPNKREDPTH